MEESSDTDSASGFAAILRQRRIDTGLTQAVPGERAGLSLRGIQHLDDETLGRYVRLLRNAYQRGDRSRVRAEAARLLVVLPGDFEAGQTLLRRLRDVGE